MTPTLTWPQRLPAPAASPAVDEIHLWQTDLDDLAPDRATLSDTVSLREQERARRLFFEAHRRRYLVCRAWLRSVLGVYLNLPPRAVPLAAKAHGKPCIAAKANHVGLQFNLSHCGRHALLAVTAGREIGVDLQSALPDAAWPAVARRFCTPAECEHVRALRPESRALAFAEIWTRKEAAGKATGDGLTSRLSSIVVGPASWGLVDCGAGLFVWSLPAQDRFAAAIALQEPV